MVFKNTLQLFNENFECYIYIHIWRYISDTITFMTSTYYKYELKHYESIKSLNFMETDKIKKKNAIWKFSL